jgi:hypothetical protein
MKRIIKTVMKTNKAIMKTIIEMIIFHNNTFKYKAKNIIFDDLY